LRNIIAEVQQRNQTAQEMLNRLDKDVRLDVKREFRDICFSNQIDVSDLKAKQGHHPKQKQYSVRVAMAALGAVTSWSVTAAQAETKAYRLMIKKAKDHIANGKPDRRPLIMPATFNAKSTQQQPPKFSLAPLKPFFWPAATLFNKDSQPGASTSVDKSDSVIAPSSSSTSSLPDELAEVPQHEYEKPKAKKSSSTKLSSKNTSPKKSVPKKQIHPSFSSITSDDIVVIDLE
jgi:hypothetical protein